MTDPKNGLPYPDPDPGAPYALIYGREGAAPPDVLEDGPYEDPYAARRAYRPDTARRYGGCLLVARWVPGGACYIALDVIPASAYGWAPPRRHWPILGPDDTCWVVVDPTPASELEDVLYQTTLRGLGQCFRGGLTAPTIYLDRAAAEADAAARLARCHRCPYCHAWCDCADHDEDALSDNCSHACDWTPDDDEDGPESQA